MAVGDPYRISANTAGRARDIYSAVDRGTQNAETLQDYAGQIAGSMNEFINPYYDQVIDRALGRMAETRDKSLQSVHNQAANTRAFGSHRHQLLQGDVHEGYMQSAGDLSARLYQQMFDTALGATQQAENQRLANMGLKLNTGGAFQGLSSQFFDYGDRITGAQAQAGNLQRQLAQQLLTGGNAAYDEYTKSPMTAIDLINAVLSGDPRQSATTSSRTQSQELGMLDYVAAAAQIGSRIATKGASPV